MGDGRDQNAIHHKTCPKLEHLWLRSRFVKVPSERSLGDAVLNLDYESKSPGQVATNVSTICALFLVESYAYGQTPIRRKINELVVGQFNLAFCCIIKVSFSWRDLLCCLMPIVILL